MTGTLNRTTAFKHGLGFVHVLPFNKGMKFLTGSILPALVFLAAPIQALAAPLTFHVAVDGQDSNPGTLRQPLATIEGGLVVARKARVARPESARGGIVMLIHGGTYHLTKPIVLTPADSGVSDDARFTIAGYGQDKPVLSGGQRLTGWRPVAGKVGLWETKLPQINGSNAHFRSLFVNGVRGQRARTPNEGFFRIDGSRAEDKPLKFRHHPGDVKKAWAEAGAVEVVAFFAWANVRMYIRGVDEENRMVILSGDPRPSNREDNARYFIENAPESLDVPGEWQLDAAQGNVRYHARSGEDLTKAEVVAGSLDDLLLFQGDAAGTNPVHHVELRGLTFSYTDWSLAPAGYADTQAAVAIRGDIRAEAASDCRVIDCRFVHLAGYALELGRGCQRWKIVGNEMTDLGAGGVRLGETARGTEPSAGNHSHVVTDNHIHHAGLVYPPAVGVFILQSGTNQVAHNHIHHLYYTAISVGWNWGYQETPCRENIVEFNHLHDIGQSMLSDMGAVYTLGIQKGSVVRNNLIHDVNASTYGGWGLYPDEGSSDIVFENNLVYRCKSAGFHQHYGRENIVRNNIFAFGQEYQLMRTREEAHLSFIFTNNIVYLNSGALLGSNWKNDRFVMANNIYFDARHQTGPSNMTFGGAAWADWRRRGHDTNSLIADPLFVAPENFNFGLRPGSPGLKRGFKPIDVSRVGPRK